MSFDFNPNNVDLGFPLFEKGDYIFKISAPKSWKRVQDEVIKEGVSYMLVCVRDDTGNNMVGKKYNASFELTADYGEQNAMKFLVAATGFKSTDEGVKAFREKFGSLSWRCNVDDNSCGEGWHIAKELEVGLSMNTDIAKKDGKSVKQGDKIQS